MPLLFLTHCLYVIFHLVSPVKSSLVSPGGGDSLSSSQMSNHFDKVPTATVNGVYGIRAIVS